MYYAEKGKLFVRKDDDFIMGDAICLSENDKIKNYVEKDFSEDEIKAFGDGVGIKDNKD